MQLGSFLRHADGRIDIVEGRLLRNITGLPLPLHKVETIQKLIGVQAQFFPATHIAHGLNPKHISAWYVLLRPAEGKPYCYGPIISKTSWGGMVTRLSNLISTPCESHKVPGCPLCHATPIVIACFEDGHLRNALAAHGLAPETRIDFLDHASTALNEMFTSAATDTLRQSIANMRKEILAKPPRVLTTPYNLPAYVGDEYIGSLLLAAPHSLGLSTAATLSAWVKVAPPQLGNARVQTQHYSVQLGRHLSSRALKVIPNSITAASVLGDRPAAQQISPVLLPHRNAVSAICDSTANASKKRKTCDDTPELQGRAQRSNGEIPDWKWDDVATVQPANWPKAKAETDTCLTCISSKRNCVGTELDKEGRCMNCTKRQGHGGRKCYWKDPKRGIRTYADAKQADPEARYVYSNTRAGKPGKAQMLAQEQGQKDLAGVGVDASNSEDRVELTRVERPIPVLLKRPAKNEYKAEEKDVTNVDGIKEKKDAIEGENDSEPVKKEEVEDPQGGGDEDEAETKSRSHPILPLLLRH